MSDNSRVNSPGQVTGATGPASPSGTSSGPSNPTPGAGHKRAVGMNPRVLRRLLISRQLTEKIPDARLAFSQLEIKGKSSEPGNLFFQLSGVGNPLDIVDRPYERFFAYERLLDDLCADDKDKYNAIHKGTPFYFLAWTAFLMGDYEKAVFYMDAAVSEDKENLGGDWIKQPAGYFLTLNDSRLQSGRIITQELSAEIDTQIDRFNLVSGKALTLEGFVDKFVTPNLLAASEARSIITALYSFVLEYSDRVLMLRLRSEHGGSIEPFLVHLFKGGLIIESLLRLEYPTVTLKEKKKKVTRTPKGMGEFFKDDAFNIRYGLYQVKTNLRKSLRTLKEIIAYSKKDGSPTRAFITAYRLRNLTGHTLARTDEFKNPEDYSHLYNQVMNAVFYVIAVKLKL
jgi:hypothetical protein